MERNPWQQPGERKVTLRRLRAEDAERIREWMSNPELVRFTVLVPGPEHAMEGGTSPVATDRYLEQLFQDPRRLAFAILRGGVHVGNAGFKGYEPGTPDAECFIEIGDPADRGRGTGYVAMRLLLEHGFERLGLKEIRLGVFDFNATAIRLYRRLGFTRDGCYGWHWADGRFHEVLGMTLRRSTYRRLLKQLADRSLVPARPGSLWS